MAKRITEKAIKSELRLLNDRIKTIEKHTGAKITINKDAILSSPNKAETLKNLKNISWRALSEGKSFKHDFINMEVSGRYWTAKAGFVETTTEIQGKDAVQLLKAVAKREKITGQVERISVSGKDAGKKAIDYFTKFKSEKQWASYVKRNNRIKMKNFSDNLNEMIQYVPDAHTRQKLRHLRALIRKNPDKFVQIVEKHKLYDILKINFYDSDDQSVDLADNYPDIIEILEKEFGVSDLTNLTIEAVYRLV